MSQEEQILFKEGRRSRKREAIKDDEFWTIAASSRAVLGGRQLKDLRDCRLGRRRRLLHLAESLRSTAAKQAGPRWHLLQQQRQQQSSVPLFWPPQHVVVLVEGAKRKREERKNKKPVSSSVCLSVGLCRPGLNYHRDTHLLNEAMKFLLVPRLCRHLELRQV